MIGSQEELLDLVDEVVGVPRNQKVVGAVRGST